MMTTTLMPMTNTDELQPVPTDADGLEPLRSELAGIFLEKTGDWKAVYWSAIDEIINRGWRPVKPADDVDHEPLREELADILLEKTGDWKAVYWRAIDLILERGWRPTK